MKRESWDKLKEGSIVKMIRSGVRRIVISASGKGHITLRSISSGSYHMWSGHITKHTPGVTETTYVTCDRHNFKVIKF